MSPLNAHADIFSGARGLNFALDMVRTALKSTGKSLKGLEKSLNSTIFCRTETLLIDI